MTILGIKLRKLAGAIASTDIITKYLHDSFDGIGSVTILDKLNINNENYGKLHNTVLSQQCFASVLRQLACTIDDYDDEVSKLHAVIEQYNSLPWYKRLFRRINLQNNI